MRVDLHTHSNKSDGSFTPKEIVQRALEKGLDVIAITDHDSIDGLLEAKNFLKGNTRIQFLNGVELSTDYNGISVHILGYGFDANNKRLIEMLEDLKTRRINRSVEMIEKLNQLGINISLNNIQKSLDEGSVGRVHIAKELVKIKECINIQDAFDKYLDEATGKAYVCSPKLNTLEAIEFLLSVDAIPVIAHPGQIRFKNSYSLSILVEKCVERGLKGIEVYYPSHCLAKIAKLKKMAKKYKLIQTIGSDFHGGNAKVDIGAIKTRMNVDVLKELNLEKNGNGIQK